MKTGSLCEVAVTVALLAATLSACSSDTKSDTTKRDAAPDVKDANADVLDAPKTPVADVGPGKDVPVGTTDTVSPTPTDTAQGKDAPPSTLDGNTALDGNTSPPVDGGPSRDVLSDLVDTGTSPQLDTSVTLDVANQLDGADNEVLNPMDSAIEVQSGMDQALDGVADLPAGDVSTQAANFSFTATAFITATETYKKYQLVQNPYAFCYNQKNYPATYQGGVLYGEYPTSDGPCGGGGSFNDDTARWYAVYKVEPTSLSTDIRTATKIFTGIVNADNNGDLQHGLLLGPLNGTVQPLHDVATTSGAPSTWRLEESQGIQYSVSTTCDNGAVNIYFSNPSGAATTTDPTASVLAWTQRRQQ
jgi:hypothetical protein